MSRAGNDSEHWETPVPARRPRRLLAAVAVVALALAVAVPALREPSPTLVVDPEPAVAQAQRWLHAGGGKALAHGTGAGEVVVAEVDDTLRALDADTGAVRWSLPYRGAFGATVHAGSVYTTGDDGWLRRLDAATGRLQWRFHPSGGRVMSLPPAVDGGMVFATVATHPGGRLYAVDADSGAQRWHVDLAKPPYFGIHLHAGRVILSQDDAVIAIDAATGARAWALPAGPAPFVGPVTGDAVAVVAASTVALVAGDGTVAWTRALEGARVWGRAAGAGGRVVVALWDGRVVGLDAATGKTGWECECGARTAPTVAGGLALVGTEDGILALDVVSGVRAWRVEVPGHVRVPVQASGTAAYAATGAGVSAVDYPRV